MQRTKIIYISIMGIVLLIILGLIYYNNNYKLNSFKFLSFTQEFNKAQKLNILEFEKKQKCRQIYY